MCRLRTLTHLQYAIRQRRKPQLPCPNLHLSQNHKSQRSPNNPRQQLPLPPPVRKHNQVRNGSVAIVHSSTKLSHHGVKCAMPRSLIENRRLYFQASPLNNKVSEALVLSSRKQLTHSVQRVARESSWKRRMIQIVLLLPSLKSELKWSLKVAYLTS